eukprot:NODE_681_length_1430_cov_3.570601_g510_i0.p2 GENE.NODE_681_length_1430_cov_3.570601_g510_i0~~NODE_681_length_1430_cov_3.570601_g510_i0.p2  ORF type:complete len:166 (+),score=22.32 NODE_681_length_1430_cov_3.570601_g510_i0:909-1406(+)
MLCVANHPTLKPLLMASQGTHTVDEPVHSVLKDATVTLEAGVPKLPYVGLWEPENDDNSGSWGHLAKTFPSFSLIVAGVPKGQKWRDPDFGPNDSSIMNRPESKLRPSKWARISEIFDNPVFWISGKGEAYDCADLCHGVSSCTPPPHTLLTHSSYTLDTLIIHS